MKSSCEQGSPGSSSHCRLSRPCADDFCHWAKHGQNQPPQKRALATEMTPSSRNDTYLACQASGAGSSASRFACATSTGIFPVRVLLLSLLKGTNGLLLFLLSAYSSQPVLICALLIVFVSGLSSHCLRNAWETLMKHKNVLICENSKRFT